MPLMGYPVKKCDLCGELYSGYWCPYCDKKKEAKNEKNKSN